MTEHQDIKRPDEEFEEEKKEFWIHLAVALGFTIGLATTLDRLVQGFPLGFNIPFFNEPATVSLIIYHVTVIATGAYIGYIGLRELIVEKKFSVEFLMAVAALGAVYLDFLFEGAMVLFLYSLAEYFEDYIEDSVRKTVTKLSAYMPEEARIVENGSEKAVDVERVDIGTTVLVKPGERIPLDATVIAGFSYVDQSLVTGESIPVFKKAGDNVFAGTLNTDGVLKLNVTKRVGETLVSRIVKLVMQSRKRKASIEKLVDRFARVYVPIVILLAVFTAVFMPTIAGGSYQTWIYRSLILLVVSCPSAFIVSVPATMFTTITVAARKGVIIKGGVYLEKMAKVKAVVFDKTGTLTLGKPVVHDVKAVEPEERVLMYAAALEQFSNHPLAQAVVRKALERNLDFTKLEVKEIKEIPGKGMVGYVNGVQVVVGNMELMKQYNCNCEQISGIYQNEKHSFVCVSIDRTATASIRIIDDVRNDAIEAIKALKKARLHTAMLTGDKAEIAREIAERLDIDNVHAELFPEDKLKIIDQIKTEHGLVAMVGDGINDAPALAASDVGIAMGGGGVDVALESADIVLVKDELIKIPYIHRLSNLTVTIAKQNIVVSLAMKFLLGALGFIGLIPLWFTVAAGDDGLTMLVLLNTLRLARVKA